jgi:hypothetical protein
LDVTPATLRSGYVVVAPAQQTAPPKIELLSMAFPAITVEATFAFLLLLCLSFIYANTIWLVERQNGDMIRRVYAEGVFDAWYMSIAVATTAGYGDKVPKTFVGKVLTLFWIFCAYYCVGMFAASITSDLVSSKIPGVLSSPLKRPADLVDKKVGIYFKEAKRVLQQVEPRCKDDDIIYYPDINWAYTSLARGDVDAIIDDLRVAQYQVALPTLIGKVIISGASFLDVDYGIYFARRNGTNHPLFPHFFRAVTEYTKGSDWSVLSGFVESKWMYDRSSMTTSKTASDLVNDALLDANISFIAGLAAALVIACVATMWAIREQSNDERERQIVVGLLGVSEKIDRYECRKAAVKLFLLWDVNRDGHLSVNELHSAFLKEGFREDGLKRKLTEEALLAGGKYGDRVSRGGERDVLLELEDFQVMMMRLALEGFQAIEKHESQSLRGVTALTGHVLMLLDEFRDHADQVEMKVDNMATVLDKVIGEEDEGLRMLGSSRKNDYWGKLTSQKILGHSAPSSGQVRVDMSDGNGLGLVVVDAAIESQATPSESNIGSPLSFAGQKTPLRTPALENMLMKRGENIGAWPGGGSGLTPGGQMFPNRGPNSSTSAPNRGTV